MSDTDMGDTSDMSTTIAVLTQRLTLLHLAEKKRMPRLAERNRRATARLAIRLMRDRPLTEGDRIEFNRILRMASAGREATGDEPSSVPFSGIIDLERLKQLVLW